MDRAPRVLATLQSISFLVALLALLGLVGGVLTEPVPERPLELDPGTQAPPVRLPPPADVGLQPSIAQLGSFPLGLLGGPFVDSAETVLLGGGGDGRSIGQGEQERDGPGDRDRDRGPGDGRGRDSPRGGRGDGPSKHVGRSAASPDGGGQAGAKGGSGKGGSAKGGSAKGGLGARMAAAHAGPPAPVKGAGQGNGSGKGSKGKKHGRR